MTTYTFKKNGKTYTASGKNRFEAQITIEIQEGISLAGATYEINYKLRKTHTGRA